MKGLSPIISVVLLILIAVSLAIIISYWSRTTVLEILVNSYDNYKKTAGVVAASFFNLLK